MSGHDYPACGLFRGGLCTCDADDDVPLSREHFEQKAWNLYFISSVKRNPNPPRGTGAMDFISTAELNTAQLCEREGDDYKCDEISAMWQGYQFAMKHVGIPA